MSTTNPATSSAIFITSVAGVGQFLNHDPTFWIVVFAVTFLKLGYSETPLGVNISRWRKFGKYMFLFAAAVIPAFVATKGVAELIGIESKPVEYLIAAGLVITGDGLVRWLMRVSNDPKALIEIWKSLRK